MKSINLISGLAAITTIVGVATPACAATINEQYVGVTVHLVDKLTGEKIAEDVHLYEQYFRSTSDSEKGNVVNLELPYLAGYNALGNDHLAADGKTYMVDVPNKATEVSTTVYYEKTDGSTQNSTTGWHKSSDFWYYNNSDGKMKTGWLKDGGNSYYLGVSGKMKTGWLNDGKDLYYFYTNGQMATGFVSYGSDYFYFDESNTDNIGKMKTGWQKINDYWYYFNTSSDSGIIGKMKTGWQKIEGVWYYFYYGDRNMARNTSIGEGYYGDGKMAFNTTISGYTINSNGACDLYESKDTNNESDTTKASDTVKVSDATEASDATK